ncbi:hypothetical protein EC973_006751 [Apophysomyces ossiformis]|uniref:RRM domain-containing protein n=1 Tax=Apophysomyces ossiformis TaxID=679940 RepID=A0A8H7ES34_9FUNG|nr:hypothetical protein EC973_006751 [Apophysomyces ossiformis]
MFHKSDSDLKAISRSRHSRSPSPRRRRRSPSYDRSRSPYSRSPSYSRSRSRSRSFSRSRSPPRRRRSLSPPRIIVLVAKLTRNVTADHVKEIFSQFGTIKHVEFPFNERLNANMGKAYVEYETQEDADKAISYMDGGQLDGQRLECLMAPPRRRSPSLSPPPRRRSRNISPPVSYRRRGPPPPMRRGGVDRYYGSGRRQSRSRSPIRRVILEVEAEAMIASAAAVVARVAPLQAVAVVAVVAEASLPLDVVGVVASVDRRLEIEAEEGVNGSVLSVLTLGK